MGSFVIGALDFIYLLIYCLCNDTVSSPSYVASNVRVINELERIWKEVVMA
jgi:hypothetical protein